MSKKFNSIIGIILAIMLCISFTSVTAFAETQQSDVTAAEPVGESSVAEPPATPTDLPAEAPPSPIEEPPAEPNEDQVPGVIESQPPEFGDTQVQNSDDGQQTPPDDIQTTDSEADAPVTPNDSSPANPEEEKPEENQVTPPNNLTPVEPEPVKVVNEPLVKVIYHYYDTEQNQAVTDFSEYTAQSSHSYYAMAAASDTGITIAANKYPGRIPVSTDALRFRVLLNNSEDISSVASYDPVTGFVSVPSEYMGHKIAVEWYCPASEVVELPVKVTASVYKNGAFTATTHDLMVASNATAISIPFTESNGLVVSQNGIDLDTGLCTVDGGILNVTTSPLGGGLAVTAYAPARMARGMMAAMGATQKVNHTRSASQVYYGYYTSYYTANGNTAFCLDPHLSGVNTGTYDVSGYIQRGAGYDDLIKAAYYLYGGPGYNSVKNNLFSDPDSMESYGLCHAAASYMWLDDPTAFKGLSSTTIGHLQNVIAAVNAQAMPPDGFEAFWYNVGSTTNQSLMSWEYAPTGNLEIQKVSANSDMTSGNDCYSLEGAVFEVYNGSNKKLGSITTNAEGRGRLEGIDASETGMYIVEVKPPKGYAKNTAKIEFQIVSGQTVTKTISDLPQNDPIGIVLRKQDKDTSKAEPQGGALLSGAEFTVKYYKGLYSSASQLAGLKSARTWVLRTGPNGTAYLNNDYLVSGDPFYYAGNQNPALPLGTVTVQETKAPEGYRANTQLFIRQIPSKGERESVEVYNEPIAEEPIIRGGISIEKWDFELDRKATPQGMATLAGSVLEIFNRNNKSVVVGGTEYAPGAVVHTMTTNAAGAAGTAADLLPYGRYEIIEKTPPAGYLNTGVIKQTFDIIEDGAMVNLIASDKVIKNNVIRGGVFIEKWDIERDARTLKQGDAVLSESTLEIWNRSDNSVVVGGKEYAPGAIVYTMKTNTAGEAGTANDLLPYGDYEIIEKTPPTGYLGTGIIRRAFKIRENGVVVKLTGSEQVIKNHIIRGGVLVEKWDHETGKHKPQGGATFEGATFELVNRSADSVLVGGELYAVGEVIYTMTTDKDGSAITPADLLPYGTYECREISPPLEGYLATGILSRMFEIREHGKIVELNTADTAIRNNPIRGDLRGVKISDGDHKRMAGIPFKITSLTTGENHVLITDKNGELNTASAWNPHSQDTNRGETDRDGVWFGEIETLNDELGALLYDDYLIEELPCEANKNKELLSFEISIYRHSTVVDLGTMTNDYIPTPEIFTTAMDQETTTNIAYTSKTTTIVDTVYYSGLKVGNEYTVKGVLMDQSSGQPLLSDGKTVTAETVFRAPSDAGSVTMKFTFDSSVLRGKAVVVFESLDFENKEIAVHADITDKDQTVTFIDPKIGTLAAGNDGSKVIPLSEKAVIVDTVSYSGLKTGEVYSLRGVLMDKATGKPLLIDGKEVAAETEFKAETESGKVQVTFTFSAFALKGKTLVVFETLKYQKREIAVHTDINDQGQTVTVREPKIGTSAKTNDGSKTVPLNERAVVVDTVTYEGLTAGKTYLLKGILMDKATGKPILVNGKEVTAESTFVAKEAAGSAEVTFTFNSTALSGKTLVVFESLIYQETEIAAHADINDQAQAVTIATRPPVGSSPQTGRDGLPIWLLIIAGLAVAGSVPFMRYLRKRGQQIGNE